MQPEGGGLLLKVSYRLFRCLAGQAELVTLAGRLPKYDAQIGISSHVGQFK